MGSNGMLHLSKSQLIKLKFIDLSTFLFNLDQILSEEDVSTVIRFLEFPA